MGVEEKIRTIIAEQLEVLVVFEQKGICRGVEVEVLGVIGEERENQGEEGERHPRPSKNQSLISR